MKLSCCTQPESYFLEIVLRMLLKNALVDPRSRWEDHTQENRVHTQMLPIARHRRERRTYTYVARRKRRK